MERKREKERERVEKVAKGNKSRERCVRNPAMETLTWTAGHLTMLENVTTGWLNIIGQVCTLQVPRSLG